jgi:hypothetical protein
MQLVVNCSPSAGCAVRHPMGLCYQRKCCSVRHTCDKIRDVLGSSNRLSPFVKYEYVKAQRKNELYHEQVEKVTCPKLKFQLSDERVLSSTMATQWHVQVSDFRKLEGGLHDTLTRHLDAIRIFV